MFEYNFFLILSLSFVPAVLAQNVQRALEADEAATWLISVELKSKRVCSGVQVSSEWILTLASCVSKKKIAKYSVVFADGETRDIVAEKRSKSLVLLKTDSNQVEAGDYAELANKNIPSKFDGTFRYYNLDNTDTVTATSVDLAADSDCLQQGVDGKYKKKDNFCFEASATKKCSLKPGLPIFGVKGDKWLLLGLSTIETNICDGSYRKAVKISKFRDWILKESMAIDCGALPSIKKGKAELDDSLSSTAGSTAIVTCKPGYETDLPSITCKSTGKWQSAKCTIKDCGSLPSISFGTVTLDSKSTRYGSTASVICDAGYGTEKESIVCQSTGVWETATCSIEDNQGPCSLPGISSTEEFEQCTVLDNDGNYNLFWNSNDTHVVFEAHVRTRGWVGLGISKNGKMFPGDVTVGWVQDDGAVHFADRHTVGYRMPVMDVSQDWFLLHGEENDFGTVIKFVRKINTCDDAEDEMISEGTTRLIYAFGDADPADDNSIRYHGSNRGSKRVSLLSPQADKAQFPADTTNYDLLNSDVRRSVPACE